MGTHVLILNNGMLIKLPRKVATNISTTIRGLKPTFENAEPINPTKIKPAVAIKIKSRIPKSKMLWGQ